MSTQQKQFNATRAGQIALSDAASERATAFMMAAFLRRRGIPTYDDAFLHTASGATLAAVKADLLADYNAALRPSSPNFTPAAHAKGKA